MTEDQWQKITSLFEAALDVKPEERRNFLAEACQGDKEMQQEVESLMTEHEQAGHFLEEPILDSVSDPTGEPERYDGSAGASPEQTPRPSFEGILIKGRYLIERELGSGGVGVVYLAIDQQLHSKKVVIKALQDKSYQNAWFLKKFHQEIEALSRLDHPGIVTVSDAGEMPDGKPFYVMQYVEGMTLRSHLKPEGMEPEWVAQIIQQVGQALSAAHAKGILHLDLKPSNIMIQNSEDGEVRARLIDFGVAKIRDPQFTGDSDKTSLGGTLDYMAPEQIKGMPAASSDIFALGVIAYEMLTGRRLFRAASTADLYQHQKTRNFPKPREVRPDLPASAEKAILQALEFETQDRFKQARDFGDELASILLKPGSAAFVRPRWILVAAALILAAGISIWRILPALHPARASGSRPYLQQIAPHGSVKVSPDGNWLAYRHPETYQLWIENLHSGESRLLLPQAIEGLYAWSRDSKRLAVETVDLQAEKVRRLETVALEDGARKLILKQESKVLPEIHDWSPDGHGILCRFDLPNGQEQIALLSLEDKQLQPLATATSPINWMHLSPDGRLMVYAAMRQENWDIYLTRADTQDGQELRLTNDPAAEVAPLWSPDGKLILYLRSSGNSGDLWGLRVDPADGSRLSEPFLLAKLGLSKIPLWSISAEGELFYETAKELFPRIFFLDIDQNTGLPKEEAVSPFLDGTLYPLWSWDGKSFYYYKDAYIERNIATKEERIIHFPTAYRLDFACPSPDGRSWAFLAGGRLYQYFPKSGKTIALFKSEGWPNPPMSWSPDGEELVWPEYHQKENRHAVKILNRLNGIVREVAYTQQTQPNPRWSPDGREIAYTNGDCLEVVSRDGGPKRKVTCAPDSHTPSANGSYLFAGDISWSRDGRRIAWTVHNVADKRVDIWLVDYFSGNHIAWPGDPNYETTPTSPQWSPDGTQIAFQRNYKPQYEVWRLSNFLPAK